MPLNTKHRFLISSQVGINLSLISTLTAAPTAERHLSYDQSELARGKILESLVVLPDQKSPIIAVRLAFIWRMPE